MRGNNYTLVGTKLYKNITIVLRVCLREGRCICQSMIVVVVESAGVAL